MQRVRAEGRITNQLAWPESRQAELFVILLKFTMLRASRPRSSASSSWRPWRVAMADVAPAISRLQSELPQPSLGPLIEVVSYANMTTAKQILLALCLAGLAGCSTNKQPSQGTPAPLPSATAQRSDSAGLEFLADIPAYKGVSLNVSEKQLLKILRKHKIPYTEDRRANQSVTYWTHPKEHVLVAVGFREGRCTGIQRLQE
jgi:hypothetical protein